MVELELATEPDLSRKPECTGSWFGAGALEFALSCVCVCVLGDWRRMYTGVLIGHEAIHRYAVAETGEFVAWVFVF